MHRHRKWFSAGHCLWTGCIIPGCPDHRAHGGVIWTEYCRCGAHRRVEACAGWRNYGRWIGGDEQSPDPIARAAEEIGAVRRGRHWSCVRDGRTMRLRATDLRELAKLMVTRPDALAVWLRSRGGTP